MSHEMQSGLDSLNREIARFGGFRKRWAVLHGLSIAVLALPGTLLVWFALDWAFKLPAWPLFVLFVLAAGYGVVTACLRLGKPLLQRIVIRHEANVIESLHGDLDNQLIGSLELGQEVVDTQAKGGKLGYSAEFVALLLQQTTERLSGLRVHTLVDLKRSKRLLASAGAVALLVLLCFVLVPDAVKERASRLQDAYASVLDTLFPVTFAVQPGDIAVVRGRPVELSVEVKGARRTEVRLLRTDIETEETVSTNLTLDAQKNAAFKIDAADQSFSYVFEYGGRPTTSYKVLVDDLPEINAINYELAPPVYTGQPARTLTGRLPRIAGLAGTSVLVSFAATTDLHPDLCYVEWADGSKQALSISGRFAHFGFTLAKPDRATIHLTGILGKGFEMERPLSFELAVQADAPPAVRVTLRTRQITMLADEAANFVLDWIAEDDFGVTDVNLDYRIDTVDAMLGRAPREATIPRRIEPARDLAKGRFAEMFAALDPALQPGDRITLTLTARDNNTETGPGIGKSLPVEIVIVRPDLSGFVEKKFGFGTPALLGGLQKVKRATDLMVDPVKTVRTETPQPVEKQDIKVRAEHESAPASAGDAQADYFNLLSGGAN